MSRFGKQGYRCDWCGMFTSSVDGEYTKPDGISAGYIHGPEWDKSGPKDICEECAQKLDQKGNPFGQKNDAKRH